MCLIMIVIPYVLKPLNNIQQFTPKLNECGQFITDELIAKEVLYYYATHRPLIILWKISLLSH